MNKIPTLSLRPFTLENRNAMVQAFWIGTFALLTAVGAQIEIPHQPVPYTFQTFFVLTAGALLGCRSGALSQVAYLLAGVIGFPVFSGLGFGIAKLTGPSGGYLMSFPIAAFAVGYLNSLNKGFVRSLVSMAVGLFVIFSLGTVHLNFVFFHDWSKSISAGFLIFSWWDGLKLFAAAGIIRQIEKYKKP